MNLPTDKPATSPQGPDDGRRSPSVRARQPHHQAARMLRWSVDRIAPAGGPMSRFWVICWLLTVVVGTRIEMHGGLKIYRGSAAAARCYVEADRSRADDYYLTEGSGLAELYSASRESVGRRARPPPGVARRERLRTVGGRARRRHRRSQGPAAHRRARCPLRRGGGERPEDLVDRRRGPPGARGGVRRRSTARSGGDHRLGGRARHHAGGVPRLPGPDTGDRDRGRRRPALHLQGR